jgi:hypothetical protein
MQKKLKNKKRKKQKNYEKKYLKRNRVNINFELRPCVESVKNENNILMTKTWYLNFIKQLIATYNQGQPYFIIKTHPKTCDLAGIFRKLGIVRKIKIQEFLEDKKYNLYRIPKKIKGAFMIV